MTVLNLQGLETELGGPGPFEGQVTLEYVSGSRGFVEVDGEKLILPKTITVPIVGGVPTRVLEVTPTRGLCALKITVAARSGGV